MKPFSLLPLALLLLVPGVRVTKLQPAFRPSDGSWWLAASHDQRGAFLSGCAEYDQGVLRRPYVDTHPYRAWQPAVTAYYRAHPDAARLSVPAVIARVNGQWLRLPGSHWARDPRRYFLDSVAWVQIGHHRALLLGFLSCQAAAHQSLPSASIAILIQRVNAWYGIVPTAPWRVRKHQDDWLAPVILRAEHAAAATVPRRSHRHLSR